MHHLVYPKYTRCMCLNCSALSEFPVRGLHPLSSPASVCFAVCLLSLAWALVLYARACSLIRPGHLQMTPAAILCRLVWRVGTFYHLQFAAHVLCVMRSVFLCLPLTCSHLMPCLVLLTVVFCLVPGQYVRISFRCSHALHAYLQTMGPGSYWYV